jgi:hypothetical protein
MKTSLAWQTLILPVMAVVVLFGAALARADSTGLPGQPAGGITPSSKQYDKRLPPVLPGEEIVTETGQRMRVWSSSGPVPVNPPPPQQQPYGGVPVIVDGRGQYPPPPPMHGGGAGFGGGGNLPARGR